MGSHASGFATTLGIWTIAYRCHVKNQEGQQLAQGTNTISTCITTHRVRGREDAEQQQVWAGGLSRGERAPRSEHQLVSLAWVLPSSLANFRLPTCSQRTESGGDVILFIHAEQTENPQSTGNSKVQ